jgi:quercetin dioxygenase-like cupin family protein
MDPIISINNPYLLNIDLTKALTVLADEQAWVTSPADGVSRNHLEREAEESGHTTSFVQFAPGSSFPEHSHTQN